MSFFCDLRISSQKPLNPGHGRVDLHRASHPTRPSAAPLSPGFGQAGSRVPRAAEADAEAPVPDAAPPAAAAAAEAPVTDAAPRAAAAAEARLDAVRKEKLRLRAALASKNAR